MSQSEKNVPLSKIVLYYRFSKGGDTARNLALYISGVNNNKVTSIKNYRIRKSADCKQQKPKLEFSLWQIYRFLATLSASFLKSMLNYCLKTKKLYKHQKENCTGTAKKFKFIEQCNCQNKTFSISYFSTSTNTFVEVIEKMFESILEMFKLP